MTGSEFKMKLHDLLSAGLSLNPESRILNPEITGITTDSSKVKPGFVFVAIKGGKVDGADFIPQAEQNGAVAIVRDQVAGFRIQDKIIYVENARLALAKMAAAFYGVQPENIVAVTGTDGKTSTADFFRQLMHLAEEKSASIGTIGVISGDGENLYPGSLTTPDPVSLASMLSEMKRSGIDNVAMEASSHGLAQYRLDGVRLKAAAFTNIARDHLDYHKTEEAYFAAKARLFSELLPEGGAAVLNADDSKFLELEAICKRRGHKIISFGKNGVEFAINSIKPAAHGQEAELTLFGKKYYIKVPLFGEFQVMNILAALGLAVGCGGDIEQLVANIGKLRGVSGRLEQAVLLKNGAAIFIDYAHTPMALGNILTTLRPHTNGRLHVVFGCGGDRDPGKRPLMGKIAAQLADNVLVTDDNPRSENPASIRAAVMAGCGGKISCKEVADRAQAIYLAIKQLETGDVLVIAGKGHEKMQIIGDKSLPFDDGEVARNAARELGVS
jgi:UDP-N-acetylmuramoyl-L-alanyl-D-glutamate--2,6-diaminopimelate ligase